MIGTWKRATIGLAFTAATLVGAAAPAAAATVRADASATVSTASTRTFIGIGGSPYLTVAIVQAEQRAFSKAARAGARSCELTNETVDDLTDPFQIVVHAFVTCTR